MRGRNNSLDFDVLIKKNFEFESLSIFYFNKLDFLLLYKFYLNDVTSKKKGLYLARIIHFLNTNVHYFLPIKDSLSRLYDLGLLEKDKSIRKKYKVKYWLSEKGINVVKLFFWVDAQLNK